MDALSLGSPRIDDGTMHVSTVGRQTDNHLIIVRFVNNM